MRTISLYKFIVPAGGDYVLERAAMAEGTNGAEVLPPFVASAFLQMPSLRLWTWHLPICLHLRWKGWTLKVAGVDLPPFTGMVLAVEDEVELDTTEDLSVEDPMLDEIEADLGEMPKRSPVQKPRHGPPTSWNCLR